MAEGVAITVNIAGKDYPLKVSANEQEEVIAIEAEIRKHLEALQNDYGVRDKQDLLAMFLFQYMMSQKKNNNAVAQDEGLHDKLKDLEEFVSSYLKS